MANPTDRVSLQALQNMLSQTSAEAFLATMTIEHPSFATPLRFIQDVVDLTRSDGTTYIAYPFKLQLPDDRDDQIPTVTLTIGNVDRRIIPAIRGITPPPPIVTVGVIMRSDPDNEVIVPLQFTMTSVDYNATQITATLTYEFRLSAKFPRDAINPATCPGVF